jgi:hypothetical protein
MPAKTYALAADNYFPQDFARLERMASQWLNNHTLPNPAFKPYGKYVCVSQLCMKNCCAVLAVTGYFCPLRR